MMVKESLSQRNHIPWIVRATVILALLSCRANGYNVNPHPSRHLSTTNGPTAMNRRSMISIIGSAATTTIFTLSAPNDATAAGISTNPNEAIKSKPDIVEIPIQDFTISIPASWKVTSNTSSSKNTNKPNTSKRSNNSKIFSAIDLQSGSVMTVVEEQTCSAQEYAQSINSCDLPLSPLKRIFSQDTIDKDISKLLIRHDDRDNTALQGTTKLDTYNIDRGANDNLLDLTVTTTIPSGGTYRDTMGIDRPNMVERRVKAKALVKNGTAQIGAEDGQTLLGGESTRILTLWLSAPMDEWQKPVMGTKLNQIWDSITIN
eukprot:scaffold162_cov267-Chaetoceros_neogracile.AAC.39